MKPNSFILNHERTCVAGTTCTNASCADHGIQKQAKLGQVHLEGTQLYYTNMHDRLCREKLSSKTTNLKFARIPTAIVNTMSHRQECFTGGKSAQLATTTWLLRPFDEAS